MYVMWDYVKILKLELGQWDKNANDEIIVFERA